MVKLSFTDKSTPDVLNDGRPLWFKTGHRFHNGTCRIGIGRWEMVDRNRRDRLPIICKLNRCLIEEPINLCPRFTFLTNRKIQLYPFKKMFSLVFAVRRQNWRGMSDPSVFVDGER